VCRSGAAVIASPGAGNAPLGAIQEIRYTESA
jgi:hypothetical protein